MNKNKLWKTLVRTGLSLLEEPDRTMRDVRNRMWDGVDRVRDGVDGVQRRITGEDHSLRYALMFAAGIGVGVGVGLLAAPARGEETRAAISNNVREVASRVKSRVSQAQEGDLAANY
jgi:YtxH-like protein